MVISIPREATTKYIATRKSPAAMKVTLRRAAAGFVRSSTFIIPTPTIEARSPTITVRIGRATASRFVVVIAMVILRLAGLAWGLRTPGADVVTPRVFRDEDPHDDDES